MDITDTTEPVMPFCRILDEADCDMHFSIVIGQNRLYPHP
jgi:hypothetical protein